MTWKPPKSLEKMDSHDLYEHGYRFRIQSGWWTVYWIPLTVDQPDWKSQKKLVASGHLANIEKKVETWGIAKLNDAALKHAIEYATADFIKKRMK
jgi:hypothetical protein